MIRGKLFFYCIKRTEYPWRRDHNDVDIIRVSAGVTVTVESKQQTWTKQSLPQRYLCVGCPIKSDQAIRSLCLKGHVRARDSMLWRYRWQEASEFFCTKTPLFWRELSNQKYRPKTPEMLSPIRYWCHVFKISRMTQQTPLVFAASSAKFWKHDINSASERAMLRAVFWIRASHGFNKFD